ncbi:MAG: hypothetical protein MHM6MM_005427 [Cercozoa sp. M6MM]
MGKRKAKKRVIKKQKEKIDKIFDCPFCCHEKVVECVLDMKEKKMGTLKCRVCGASFQAPITKLSSAIDVYSDWIDECRRENELEDAPRRDDDGANPDLGDEFDEDADLDDLNAEDDYAGI